jgi:hypothetical protein
LGLVLLSPSACCVVGAGCSTRKPCGVQCCSALIFMFMSPYLNRHIAILPTRVSFSVYYIGRRTGSGMVGDGLGWLLTGMGVLLSLF